MVGKELSSCKPSTTTLYPSYQIIGIYTAGVSSLVTLGESVTSKHSFRLNSTFHKIENIYLENVLVLSDMPKQVSKQKIFKYKIIEDKTYYTN